MGNTMEVQLLHAPKAYKRSPELSNSRWYKGFLFSQMAGTGDNNGAFDVDIAKIRPGIEPPPHVHAREDEFLYILSGEMNFYVDGKVFSAGAGECVFLPRRKPHAWLITSEEVHTILVTAPGGFTDAIHKLSAPAERMELPTDADTPTYATADPTETIKVFVLHSMRLLTPEEIRKETPAYPH